MMTPSPYGALSDELEGRPRLTLPQRKVLEQFRYGWTISHPARASAPLRRLIARGFIAKTGVVRGRPYFAATDAGLRALRSLQTGDAK